jgi:Bacterial Ig domain
VGDSDSFTGTSEDIAITGNVQDNDFDADADPTRSLVATTTSHGVLNLGDDGLFTYTPDVNYFGSDSFTYTLTDGLATTGPITVDLTVPAGGPFDLDGHDRATQTVWMPEPDEGVYGLGVSTSDSATIFARVYNVPPDMVIDRRRINFNPSVLSVNGVTSPGYIELSPSGGNEVLTVTALVEGYGSSGINYEIFGHFNTGGLLGEGFASLCSMPVVEEKAVLCQLEFTSDHNVIRNNTRIDITSGDRYSDVEFVSRTKYNAPMTQTRSYDGQPSKMKVKVSLGWEGIPANTTFKLVGTTEETALQFESAPLTTANLAGGVTEVTATNDVGKKIRTISGTIAWKMIVNPGPNQKELSMGTSGSHKIYVLFGKPGKQDRKPFQATDIRMDRTVAVASKALENAQAAVPPGTTTLTWQRIAYHVAQLQKFNGERNLVEAPLDDKQIANGWVVYTTWNYTPPGVDCISGATFAWLVVVASGMPGESSADALAPKSATEPTKAVSYDPTDAARHRNAGKEDLGMLDRSTAAGVYNNFEAALIYTPGPGASTFYFPIGVGDARFTNKDDVISVMKQAVWVRHGTIVVVEKIDPVYTQAANVSID